MLIEKNLPLLDEILSEWKDVIGKDFLGYKNHVYRVLNYCFVLHDASEEDREKLIIAACFHDIGLWPDHSLDYLPPSIVKAREYLERKKLQHWSPEIELIIDMHHKVGTYKNDKYPLVEVFRKADLVDFSLGLVKTGISKDYVRLIKANFPNAGFHKMLLRVQLRWLIRYPLNPLPIIKW